MRYIILLLSLGVVTLLLSNILWDRFGSHAVKIAQFGMTFIKKAPYNYTNYTIKNTGNWLAQNDPNSTGSMTSTCVFPNVDPYEPSMMKIAGLEHKPLQCKGKFLPDLTFIHGDNELRVNTSLVEEYLNSSHFKHCRYRQIFRHEKSDKNFKYSEWSEPFKDKIELPENAEFFKVECTNKTDGLVSKTFYNLIPKHAELYEFDSLNLRKHQAIASPKETLNVIMIGIDGLPRHQFLRACNKTYSFLMNSLKSFDFTLHSQLGPNTFPNILPLLSGLSHEEITQWWSDEHHMDSIDLLWGTFEKAGYRTLYTEDCADIAAFHYLKKGFRNAIARYNMRPLWLAMSDDVDADIWKKYPYCVGNKEEINFQLDYVGQFLDTYPSQPVFAVAILNIPTHDIPTDIKMIDDHILNFYHSLNQKGHMNRSLAISFSDHGLRWGPIRDSISGYYSSQTPYTILTLPDWFLRKYPDVAANLKINTKRLTSHFDTHETLLDVLYFKPKITPPFALPRHGISLFRRIPRDRTCKDASIPLEHCLCGYKDLEKINITSNIAQRLANLVVDAINSKVNTTLCVILKLHRINHIIKTDLNKNNSNEEGTLYAVNLVTSPGQGRFEGNVYVATNSSDFEVRHQIFRLNMYRGTAECIDNAILREFCFCRNVTAG